MVIAFNSLAREWVPATYKSSKFNYVYILEIRDRTELLQGGWVV